MAEGSRESLSVMLSSGGRSLLFQCFDIPMMDNKRLIMNIAVKYDGIGKLTAILMVNQKSFVKGRVKEEGKENKVIISSFLWFKRL